MSAKTICQLYFCQPCARITWHEIEVVEYNPNWGYGDDNYVLEGTCEECGDTWQQNSDHNPLETEYTR